MKIEVRQLKDGRFYLEINDERILVHEKLSTIVLKIEQYLKIRFLPEQQVGGLKGMFKKVMTGE